MANEAGRVIIPDALMGFDFGTGGEIMPKVKRQLALRHEVWDDEDASRAIARRNAQRRINSEFGQEALKQFANQDKVPTFDQLVAAIGSFKAEKTAHAVTQLNCLASTQSETKKKDTGLITCVRESI